MARNISIPPEWAAPSQSPPPQYYDAVSQAFTKYFFFFSAVSAYTSALKASIKSQTEFQPKLMASPTISHPRTDDIFTNLLIQHGRKALYKKDMTSARGELLDYYGQVSGTRVKSCEEIFLCSTEGEPNPKSILVTGKAGIGKTLFSQKLVRDWADDKLFQSQENLHTPDVKFAYLLTFRQLNLLGNDMFSLRELLNCSSLLDENSNIDNSLFEYLVNHPEEVLIILDGYDEYSQQDYITSYSEEQYPNNASEEMPVAALCAKLIKGKMLRDSVVMITSRPDESDNEMGGIHFDQYVEITGFSPEQVKEYIEKYFRDNETMRNTVLEHVMNNDNFVSFAHIPVLCFLMCFYLEYTLQESKSTYLPVSATDIYSEVVNIFELKHNAKSEYKSKEIPEKHKASGVVKSTLDKLSELAAQLLLQRRPTFHENDMKKKFKTKEIKKLKGSGLLHCGPPFRISAFEISKQLSFTHLTIQEFLAARWFVRRNEIPMEFVSVMVWQFIAGILSKKRDDKLMKRLLNSISITWQPLLLSAKLLNEYQDKTFAKNVIINHPQHYSDMSFANLNDVDCIAISFLLDLISELNEEEAATAQHERPEQSFNVNSLKIRESDLTLSGVKRICESLEKEHCAITELFLQLARIHFSETVIIRLCEALQHSSCKVATLYLSGNQITDTGVARLCEALQHPSCKLTTLNLSSNQVTDTGVARLCKALQLSSCKLTTLYLSDNQITDTGVARSSEALQHLSCKVTTLDLSYNRITDTGVARLCEALQHPSCKITTLYLKRNQITDAGVARLCEVINLSNCKLTSLYLWDNPISEESKESLRTLVQQHRPGFRLDI
ncbi:NACHT, LRR and PYD domains-containing protein 3-like [Oculina patagonica]